MPRSPAHPSPSLSCVPTDRAQAIALARDVLRLVQQDAGIGSPDILPTAARARLFRQALSQVGLGSSCLMVATLDGGAHEGCALKIEALDIQVPPNAVVRMNMYGDVDEQLVSGVVARWEELCGATWKGQRTPEQWHLVYAVNRGQSPTEDFALRAARMLATGRATALNRSVPVAGGLAIAHARL